MGPVRPWRFSTLKEEERGSSNQEAIERTQPDTGRMREEFWPSSYRSYRSYPDPYIITTDRITRIVITSSVIFTHDHGAVPLHLPVTPLTRKRYGVP